MNRSPLNTPVGIRRLRRLGTLLSVAVACLVIAAIFFPEPVKEVARRYEPMRSAYNWLLQPAYRFYRPDEIGHQGPAKDVVLQEPCSMVETSDGHIFFVDRCSYMWRIDPDQTAHVFAGVGTAGFPATVRPSRSVSLGVPQGVTLGPDGLFYIADSKFHLVLRVNKNGEISRFAGTGVPGFGGDGGAAIDASFNEPFDLDFDSSGNLYVADFRNHRVRVIDKSGNIDTVAGTGQPGYLGDGGPARNAMLNGLYGVAIDHVDCLLIADSSNHVIRRVARDGTISTIVGSGEQGFDGDGGPATAAKLDSPQEVVVTDNGEMYINDEHNHAIRRVQPDGTISTFLGKGIPGASLEGTPRNDAVLNDPEDILLRRDGTVLIIDGQNRRIISVSADGVLSSFAGR